MSSVEWVPLGEDEKPPRAVWLAPLSVMLGSMISLLPVIANVPFLPPLGLMIFLGWRLARADSMKIWVPGLLAVFDDAISGQPFGSSMLLWTVCLLMLEVIDIRIMWRDFWQDWLIASGAIAFCLIGGRLIASPLYAHVDTALVFQIALSAALFPVIARFCRWLDSDTKQS